MAQPPHKQAYSSHQPVSVARENRQELALEGSF